jgi:hypothetical protein
MDDEVSIRSHDAAGDSSSSSSAQQGVETLREQLRVMKQSGERISLYKRIPLIWAPFMSRRRLVQFIVYAGSELKAGLIEEAKQHVLMDALLLIISCSPVLAVTEVPDGWLCFVLACFYLTVVIQLCSLVCGIIWITVFIQIRTE